MTIDIDITVWHVVPAMYLVLCLGIALAWRRWRRPAAPLCGQETTTHYYSCKASAVWTCLNRCCAKCCKRLCGPECPRYTMGPLRRKALLVQLWLEGLQT